MKVTPAELKVVMRKARNIAINHARRKKAAQSVMYDQRKVTQGLDRDLNELLHIIVRMVQEEPHENT
jgi:hypothetical protein